MCTQKQRACQLDAQSWSRPGIGRVPTRRPTRPGDSNGTNGWLLFLAAENASLEVFRLLHEAGSIEGDCGYVDEGCGEED